MYPTGEKRGTSADPIIRENTKEWTYDDLRDLPESHDQIEILDGVLYMSPSAHMRHHQRVISKLFGKLHNWADGQGAGEVYTAATDVVFAHRRVLQPDLFFISKDRLDEIGAFFPGPPDMVVEVLSPSSVQYDRRQKYAIYEQSGVREYWIVDPEEQEVEVFVLKEERYERLGKWGRGASARSVVLDGFTVAVDELFK